MPAKLYIVCYGWSYFRPKQLDRTLTKPYGSTLQAYAQLFNSVEINSTFYNIPRLTTAQKWLQESSAMRSPFEFTVKAYQGITHTDRFGHKSRSYFESVVLIAEALKASVILFQSPPSFHPTPSNIRKLSSFFSTVDRRSFKLSWEPRGKWYDSPQVVAEVCEPVISSTVSIPSGTSHFSSGERR